RLGGVDPPLVQQGGEVAIAEVGVDQPPQAMLRRAQQAREIADGQSLAPPHLILVERLAQRRQKDPVLPGRGGFEGEVGTFSAPDIQEGRPVIVRFRWSDIHSSKPWWEQ